MIWYDGYFANDKRRLQKKTISVLFVGWMLLLALLLIAAPKQDPVFDDTEINEVVPAT